MGLATGRMTVGEVAAIIEQWAPGAIAWEKDNVGLQVGDSNAHVRGILVSLDITGRVVAEAKRKGFNLLISHHPLLFRPLRSITTGSDQARCLRLLLENGMNAYAAHTNLDFARGGTSFALARTLGLNQVDFLRKPYQIGKKIVSYVPAEDVDRISSAMAEAGAGRIGNYEHCSFRTRGTGTFRGTRDSKPSVGRKMKMQHIEEVRLEMMVDQWNADRVVAALRGAHPYEEVAYEIYPTENKSNDYGQGVVGQLKRPIRLKTFLALVKKRLGVKALRYTGELQQDVSRVALCGGSGSDLLDEAIRQDADVFVTADVRYHAFQEAVSRIALVDAGHYETEYPVVRALAGKLKKELARRKKAVPVSVARTLTNPLCIV